MAQITLRDYLQETEDAISAGRAEEALSRCQHMLTYFPEALEPQRLLGEVYLAQNKLEEARHAFDWVLTGDPEHVVAYCNRALISESMADYDTALDCYQQAYELSRGNGQIRSKFNAISAKAGQQGFMFSRAGLARLYMRGDLLSQAVQEWDAVLAVSPERLDARTGLLETYWCEGLYDRVEQLATRILEDVPTCLKALLLLAHVVSTKNVQRSQELLKQARNLDPDLVMAQLLFADLFAAQPAEPFLQLLKQPPAQLELSEKEPHTPLAFANEPLRREPESQPGSDLLRREPEAVPDRDLSTWGIVGTWENEGDLNASQLAANAASQDNSGLPVWSPASILGSDTRSPQPVSQSSPDLAELDTWRTSDKPLEQPSFSDSSLFGSWSQVREPEDQTIAQGQAPGEKQTWEESNSLAGVDMWKSESAVDELASLSGTWSFVSPGGGTPEPPSWLSMLTQQDRQQMSGAMPSVPSASSPEKQDVAKQDVVQRGDAIMPAAAESSAPAQPTNSVVPSQSANAAPPAQPTNSVVPSQSANAAPPAQPTNSVVPSQSANAAPPAQPVKPVAPAQPTNAAAPAQPVKPAAPAQPPAPVQPAQEVKPLSGGGVPPLEEEESLFGPAWLKSLGAFSLAPEMVQEPASLPSAGEASSASPVQKSPALQDHPTQSADSASVADAATEREQKLITTLEEIDQDLRSQGFVSLEPNMLASIAQKDAAGSSSGAPEGESATTAAEKPYQESDLSSALAELGNLRSQTQAAPDVPDEADMGMAAAAPEQMQEPEWMAALRTFQTPQDTPSPEPSEAVPPAATTQPPQQQVEEEPYWMAPMQAEPTPVAQQQTEEPEWMAALQAEQTPAVQQSQPAPVARQQQQVEEEPYWMTPMQAESFPVVQQQQQVEEPDWMAPMQAEPTPVVQQQQQVEEPDWMAPMQAEPTPVVQQQQQVEEPDWMAALQLEPTPVAQQQQVEEEPYWMAPIQMEQPQKAQQPVTPDWMETTLHREKEIAPAAQEARKSQSSNDIPTIARVNETPQPARVPDARPDRVPVTPGPVFEPVAQSMLVDTGQRARPLSVPHPEPLLDSELETTMRRPAVRLQHLQQSRSTAQREPDARGQIVERSMGKAAEGQINYKECLLRGYQHQLSGDYDEAMQAYRIVIKGSPELLGEVVSNVRALLKLAPKYSAGYRVLGDAYMRQGEYLQAMEAYNKALTMAKKARN
jgi:tetratricopeptide (TPR) repeat protein